MFIARRHRPLIGAVVTLAVIGLGVWGCDKGQKVVGGRQSLPSSFSRQEELKPETFPYDEGYLVLAGTQIPVTLEESKEGNILTFAVKANGALIEREQYQSDESGFRFLGGPGITFQPAIPLVRYPMKSDEKWEWSGKMVQSGSTYDAKAEIAAKSELLNTAAGEFMTLMIQVDLKLDVGTKEPAVRSLKFWIAPGDGVIRREFGASSTREPRAPEPTEQ